MHANERTEVKEARAGDIVAIVGLKDTTTGDTLCDSANAVILERMEFPNPVIKVSVEPKTKADQEKMGLALNRLAKEDPSFRYQRDEETGQTTIEGMGELHLEIIVDRMKREFKVTSHSTALYSLLHFTVCCSSRSIAVPCMRSAHTLTCTRTRSNWCATPHTQRRVPYDCFQCSKAPIRLLYFLMISYLTCFIRWSAMWASPRWPTERQSPRPPSSTTHTRSR